MDSPVNNVVESTSNDDMLDNKAAVESSEERTNYNDVQVLKRRNSDTAVIEISDTDSDDSDICAVTTYKATPDEVKRIRREGHNDDCSSSSSSSSSSMSSSDSYSSESEDEDDAVVVHESLEAPKVRGALFLRASRTDEPMLNPNFKKADTLESLTRHWSSETPFETEDVILLTSPYRVCLMHNVLENSEYIHNMVDDMNTLEWTRKKMDLYEFHQTSELANLTWQRSIRGIYQLLKTEIMPWVSKVTGTELSSISVSCSLYGPGDHLLPHDDLLNDRRIAFILYLAPWTPSAAAKALENGQHDISEGGIKTYGGGTDTGWCRSMGGALQLYNEKTPGQPGAVVTQVYPCNNMLAFFKVGPETYHQVAEVTSLELPRLSINGWFHGPIDDPAEETPLSEMDTIKLHNETVVMTEWLSPVYMSTVTRGQAQRQMEAESEISLPDFLLPGKYRELLAAFAEPGVVWEPLGPPHRCRFRRVCSRWLEAQEASHPLRALCTLFSSAAWGAVLCALTDLPLGRALTPQLEMWRAADYSLLPGRESYGRARLDVLLTLGAGREGGAGGARALRQYVCPESQGEAESLVCIPPQNNALVLVYADAGATYYTGYISKLAMTSDERFYVVTCTYVE